MNKRNVPYFTLFTLLDRRKPFVYIAILSVIMVFSSLFSMIAFIINSKTSPYITYDNDLILDKGIERNAVVKNIISTDDIVMPNYIVSYTYKNGKDVVPDKFETMSFREAIPFKEHDTITIKVYKNQSVIVGLTPVHSNETIYLMPLLFCIPAIIFGLISFIPAYKIYNLYKTGKVNEATVFSIFMDNGSPLGNFGKVILVNYYYYDSRSKKLFSTSATTDLSVMQEVRPNDTIKIFVSETDETKSTMVPTKLAVKNGWRI